MINVDLDNTFATSDHHFWHNNILKYCPDRKFATVEEMNEKFILYWNEIVPPDGIVHYIGDFSMAFRAVELYTKRLNGYKILYAGNHDFCHPAHKKSRNPEKLEEWRQKYIDNGWNEVRISGQIEIPGVANLEINHLPYTEPPTSGQDQRYTKFRPKNEGRWLLCGHVHQHWAQRDKMINVGVDVRNFRPISFREIVDIIQAKPEGYKLEG